MGRKSAYTQQLADEIIADISKGVPLMEICRREHMPETVSVYRWCEANPEFASRFARARAEGFDAIAQDCVKIADDASQDVIDDGKGGRMQNSVAAARARLRVETRLKLLAKWDPKRYGERLQVEETVSARLLSRAEAIAQIRDGSIDANALLDAWTKPAEPAEPVELPQIAETSQAATDESLVDLDE